MRGEAPSARLAASRAAEQLTNTDGLLRAGPYSELPQMREALAPNCWNTNQSWNFTSHWHFADHKLRVRIRRNAYDDQSFAEVSKLDPTTGDWNILRSLPIRECVCSTISYIRKGVTAGDFAADEQALLRAARTLLS